MKDIFVIINHNANAYRKASKKVKRLCKSTFKRRQYTELTDATLNEKSKRGRKKVGTALYREFYRTRSLAHYQIVLWLSDSTVFAFVSLRR